MPTPTKGPRLGGSSSHERLMLANLATSLFEHGSITTTEAKARRLRPLAERLITKSKRGDLHNRREVMKTIRDKDVVHKLFAEIGPFFADRDGGYTRIVKTMPRRGDNAPMVIISLVTERTATAEAEAARGTRFARSRSAGKAATAEPETTADETVRDAAAEQDAAGAEESAVEESVAEESPVGESTGDEESPVGESTGDEESDAEDES